MIEVSGLTKRYGKVTAVDGLSFAVTDGELFAFLGTNGAGKTTTISGMITLLPFEEGDIALDGLDVRTDAYRIRSRIGVVFQQSLLDPRLSVDENLELKADVYGIPRSRIDELAELVDLTDFRDRHYGVLSGGEKRRVDIARALLNHPKTLFLDEPTTGLDPYSREQVWNTISGLRDDLGLTVVLTTHYMQETESADRVLVIDRGVPIADGTPIELRARHSTPRLLVKPRDGRRSEVVSAIRSRLPEAGPYDRGGAVHAAIPDSAAGLDILMSLGDAVEDFQVIQGSMDDVFLNLMSERKGK